ncbi:MAG: amidase family protein [Deinococcales bacterium]
MTIGKTNTPEFGAGSQTFNAVFGATRNPYDLSKTCGGSSGGAAAALASGMLPLADGSDMGGSLRNPAAFCNVVGFRPSPGLVPNWPSRGAWGVLGVLGPMARTVQDIALMLQAISGYDERSPIISHEGPETFAQPLRAPKKGTRLAWASDLGFPVEPKIREHLAKQLKHFSNLGYEVEEAKPDFSGADEAFKTLRAAAFEMSFGELLDRKRHLLKDTVIWNIEAGRQLQGSDIGRAELLRTALYERLRRFFEDYDYLLLPVTQVLPFDVHTPYITEIDGVAMESYIDWMKSCYFISVTSLPAISMPAGFIDGLPVGLQIVGKPQADRSVLDLAYTFEEVTGFWKERPKL